MNNIELVSYILVGLIPLVYLIIYIMVQLKRKKKNRNYLYGFIVAIVIAILLFVIRLFIFTLTPFKNYIPNETTTTTTGEVTTTTEEAKTTTTKEATTTKSSGSYNYDKILNPTGGEVLGTTSKGYEVKKINGLYYVDGYLIANKTYSLPEDYNPNGMNSTVKTAYEKMFADAKKEKGYEFRNGSGFRSYASQKSIYNRYVSSDGKAKADTYSARPGYSEHQTGLALDICASGKACINSGFDNTPEAKWLSENASKYGFILRYVKGKDNETGYMYESWHFRYVGTELAEKLYNNGNWITMEDYFGLTSSYDKKPIGE